MANILVFGDSIAYGFNDFVNGGWVGKLRSHIDNINKKDSFLHSVYNLGVDGDDTQGLLKRFSTEAKLRCWPNSKNINFFEIGVNDSIVNTDKTRRTNPEKFEENLKKLTAQAKKLTKEVIFVSITPVIEEKVTPMPWSPTESYHAKEVDRYDNILKEVCAKNNVIYLDLFKQIDREVFKKYLDDGVHPNTKGHELIFETVKNFLEEISFIKY